MRNPQILSSSSSEKPILMWVAALNYNSVYPSQRLFNSLFLSHSCRSVPFDPITGNECPYPLICLLLVNAFPRPSAKVPLLRNYSEGMSTAADDSRSYQAVNVAAKQGLCYGNLWSDNNAQSYVFPLPRAHNNAECVSKYFLRRERFVCNTNN